MEPLETNAEVCDTKGKMETCILISSGEIYCPCGGGELR